MILSCVSTGSAFQRRQVVQVLLDDHVAAAGEGGVLVADDGGGDALLARRVLRAVDEADQVALVEVAKAVHLVRRRDAPPSRAMIWRRQLEAQVHALGADVEQEVARRRHGVMPAADLAERVQLRGRGAAEQPVPGIGADARDAGQPALEVAKAHRPHQCREIGAQSARGRSLSGPGIDRDHEEDREPRQPCDDRRRIQGR